MRAVEITIGSRHFRFHLYRGRVAVNVKCHTRPEISGANDRLLWAQLDESTRDRLTYEAVENVREAWWEQVRDYCDRALDRSEVVCEGRSGGYLVLWGYDESYLLQLEEDAQVDGCRRCALPPTRHYCAESMYAGGRLPLPFNDAPWDLPCVRCGDFYWQHYSTLCPAVLGSAYAPHEYEGDCLDAAVALESVTQYIETKYMDRADLQTQLDDALVDALWMHADYNGITASGTAT